MCGVLCCVVCVCSIGHMWRSEGNSFLPLCDVRAHRGVYIYQFIKGWDGETGSLIQSKVDVLRIRCWSSFCSPQGQWGPTSHSLPPDPVRSPQERVSPLLSLLLSSQVPQDKRLVPQNYWQNEFPQLCESQGLTSLSGQEQESLFTKLSHQALEFFVFVFNSIPLSKVASLFTPSEQCTR